MIPLRGMLADAYADGLIERNPMDRIRNLTVRHEEPDPFTPDERTAILNACTEPQHRNLFEFAFWTGLRTSELIALEWRDVDWQQNLVRIRRASVRKRVKGTKTRSGERNVVLLPPALEALQRQRSLTKRLTGRVFRNPRTNKPWETDGQIRKTAWQPILKRTNVRYRSPYQTRHTYASTLLSVGENPTWIAQQMGHTDWAMIRKVYGRWIPEVDTSAGDKIRAVLATNSGDHLVTNGDQNVTPPRPSQTNSDRSGADKNTLQPIDSKRSTGVRDGLGRSAQKKRIGGGGGNRTRVRKSSALGTTCLAVSTI